MATTSRIFGTEGYSNWDLKKCPVPIKLVRIKTNYLHIGFLDVDAIIAIQKYLTFRKKRTGNEIQDDDHVKDIEYEFSLGNFTKPFFIHDQVVPGAQAMAENKDKIQYSTMQIDRGSVLILSTNDTELLGSIQQFMDFQSSQHLGH